MPALHIRHDADSEFFDDDLESDTDAWKSGYDSGREEIIDNVSSILGPYGPEYGATELTIMEALEALVGRMIGLEK